MSSATALSWFARHELRLAWREWFAMMTGGRRRRAACRHDRPVLLCRAAAPAGLGRDRPLRRSAAAARQILADRDLGDDLSRLDLDAVAGDRIRDAGILCPRRSRSDHVLAGDAGQSVLGPHRRDCADRHDHRAVVLDALHRRAGDRRRRALARRLRRGHRHGPVGRSDRDCRHHPAVSPDRPGAHAPRSPRSSPRSSAPASSSRCRSPRSCPTARCRASPS